MTGDRWRARRGPRWLGDRLRAVDVPDADAVAERGWRVVSAAAAERAAARPRSRLRLPRPVAVAAASLVALAAVVFTPPGGALADWVRDTLGRDAPRPRVPAHDTLGSLPGGGRMLVESPAGVWVVRPDGSRRLLGRYEEATWSPHGLFVAVTNRDGLLAVTPAGGVRWALSRRGAESPRWAPSGFRIAYRVDGALRVVAGDGTGDRPLGRDLGTTAPAWSPTIKGNVLAASDRRGRIVVLDADTGTRWGRSRPGAHPLSLTWSADGQVLLAVTPRSLRIFDPSGREIARRPLPRGAIAGAAAFAPRGYTFALVRRLPRADGDEVVLMRGDPPGTPASPADTTGNAGGTASGRLVFRGAGRLGELAWSPDGRWLAIAWPTADQWLFVRPGSRPRVRAAGDIARQFDPAARGPAAAPAIAGWCCPF